MREAAGEAYESARNARQDVVAAVTQALERSSVTAGLALAFVESIPVGVLDTCHAWACEVAECAVVRVGGISDGDDGEDACDEEEMAPEWHVIVPGLWRTPKAARSLLFRVCLRQDDDAAQSGHGDTSGTASAVRCTARCDIAPISVTELGCCLGSDQVDVISLLGPEGVCAMDEAWEKGETRRGTKRGEEGAVQRGPDVEDVEVMWGQVSDGEGTTLGRCDESGATAIGFSSNAHAKGSLHAHAKSVAWAVLVVPFVLARQAHAIAGAALANHVSFHSSFDRPVAAGRSVPEIQTSAVRDCSKDPREIVIDGGDR